MAGKEMTDTQKLCLEVLRVLHAHRMAEIRQGQFMLILLAAAMPVGLLANIWLWTR